MYKRQVEHAAATPDTELPWAELGLKENEFEDIKEILGRRPTAAELAMYSVMWSEHCSYKSSKAVSYTHLVRPPASAGGGGLGERRGGCGAGLAPAGVGASRGRRWFRPGKRADRFSGWFSGPGRYVGRACGGHGCGRPDP